MSESYSNFLLAQEKSWKTL